MTDPLTDAVRRLKGLQEDIERLKAAQDQEGEPRLFFEQAERVLVSDVTRTRKQRTLEESGIYGQVGYNTSTIDRVEIVRLAASDTALAADLGTVNGDVIDDATFGRSGYNTTSYSAAELIRVEHAETAGADDSGSTVAVNEVAAATYGDGYQTSGYQ